MDFDNIWTPEQLDWYTDASKNPKLGFGGIFGQEWFAIKWQEMDGLDTNFLIKKDPSIQYLELYAVTASVLLWVHKVKNRRIKLYCDNKSAVDMINGNTSSCKNCMVLIRIIVLESMKFNVRIYAEHVKTDDNFLADALSRFQFGRFQKDLDKLGRQVNQEGLCVPNRIWPISKIWID